MQMNNYIDLTKLLENEELEVSCISNDHYIQLFALYLHENDFHSARYLWKRIPDDVKTGNREIERLQILCNALRKNNTADFFRCISYTWSPQIKNLMKELEDKTRKDVFTLVGNSYTSIYESKLMELTALSQEQLRQACAAMEWKLEEDAQHQTLVIPKRKTNEQPLSTQSEEQLFKLTQFVSFLEN